MANRLSLRERLMMLLIILLIATVYLQDSGFLPPASAQVAVDRFHKLFYDSRIWVTTKWLGVPTAQNPNDAWIHQEIIALVPNPISLLRLALSTAAVPPCGR